MPALSDRQALIGVILLAAEDELNMHFTQLEHADDDGDIKGPEVEPSLEPTLSSSSSTSSSSSCLSSSSSSSDAEMATASESKDKHEIHMRNVTDYADLLDSILCTRVLNPKSVAKASQLYLVLVEFKTDDLKRFRRNLRVSPDTFDGLVACIKDHPVFHNKSFVEQYPVEIQLAIALFRFGHDGNAASVEAVAQWAGVSAGMVVKATRRVSIAILALHDEVIRWPSEVEKEEAKSWVKSNSCPAWRDRFCMVDGTLIPLFEKPGHHGEAYFNWKSNYSMNVQLITLPNLRVIDYVVGHCGSAHDATVFRSSRTYVSNRTLFQQGEWLWADSAYALDRWCVTPFKKPLSNLPENKTFNYHLLRV